MPSVIRWVLSGIHRGRYGIISGVTETARLAGISLSDAVIPIVFSLIMGDTPVNQENPGHFLSAAGWAFTLHASLALIVMVLALRA